MQVKCTRLLINAAFQSWTLLKSRGASARPGLLFLRWSGHLDEAVLVEPEEPPALLLREVLGTAALVELDRRLVVLRHHEHHAGAARLHRQLREDGEEFRLVRSKGPPKSGCTLVCKHSHYWGAAGSLTRCPALQKEERFGPSMKLQSSSECKQMEMFLPLYSSIT